MSSPRPGGRGCSLSRPPRGPGLPWGCLVSRQGEAGLEEGLVLGRLGPNPPPSWLGSRTAVGPCRRRNGRPAHPVLGPVLRPAAHPEPGWSLLSTENSGRVPRAQPGVRPAGLLRRPRRLALPLLHRHVRLLPGTRLQPAWLTQNLQSQSWKAPRPIADRPLPGSCGASRLPRGGEKFWVESLGQTGISRAGSSPALRLCCSPLSSRGWSTYPAPQSRA